MLIPSGRGEFIDRGVAEAVVFVSLAVVTTNKRTGILIGRVTCSIYRL